MTKPKTGRAQKPGHKLGGSPDWRNYPPKGPAQPALAKNQLGDSWWVNMPRETLQQEATRRHPNVGPGLALRHEPCD